MPELPEVETTVRGLRNKIIGRKIKDVWTDWPKYFKNSSEREFKNCVIGRKIKDVYRSGKNILFELSEGKMMLVHMKMTGHFLIGRWERRKNVDEVYNKKWEDQKWVPENQKGNMIDSKNRFIRLIFYLDNNQMLALSDLRRFAKVLCGKKRDILNSDDLDLGVDPLSKDFSFEKFKNILTKRRKRIKSLLMDQKVITGIGNIYSDEVLWRAKIHPLTPANKIKEDKVRVLYQEIISILKKAVKLGGTSIDDFRDPEGVKGRYGRELDIYQKEGEGCERCGTEIKRIKISSRSARFCPNCQNKKS